MPDPVVTGTELNVEFAGGMATHTYIYNPTTVPAMRPLRLDMPVPPSALLKVKDVVFTPAAKCACADPDNDMWVHSPEECTYRDPEFDEIPNPGRD